MLLQFIFRFLANGIQRWRTGERMSLLFQSSTTSNQNQIPGYGSLRHRIYRRSSSQ